MNQPYSTTASTSTRILQFDTGAVIGEGAPIEGRGALGEAQGIARAVSPVVSLDGGLAGSLDGVASLAVSPEMRRAAMYLVGSERDRRKALWHLMLDYGKSTEEWSRTLTAPEADRWQGRIEGYGDAVNVLGAAPFVDATVAELAANLARGCAKFSLLPSQQRMRAYKRAARVRSDNAERNESILQDRAAGASLRKLAARYGLTVGGVRAVLVTAKKPPETAPSITAKSTPRTAVNLTAKSTPDRAFCRPSDPDPGHDSTTNNEVGTGPPLEVAGGPVLVVTEREGAAQTDKAGGCGRGQPSHGAPAPAGATSHPLVTLPTETEPASGSATDGGPEPKGPKVGERVAVVDVLRAVAAAKAGTRLPSERCPLLPDPDVVARDDVRRELFRRQAASRGVVIPEVGNDG